VFVCICGAHFDGDIGGCLLVKSKPGGRVCAMAELVDDAVSRVKTVANLDWVVTAQSVVL